MTQGTPLFLQDPSFAYAAEDFRFMVDTLFTEGVLNVSAGQLQASAPGDGSLRVLVAAGAAVIKGDDDATQGAYLARCTAAEYVSVAAPPATGSRLDLLVYELIDPAKVALNGRPKGARFRVIAGTPTTGTPTLPALPSTAMPLASVAVAAGQSAVTAGNIVDLRKQAGAATLKVGTQAQPLTSAQIEALSTAERFFGRLVANTDTSRVQFWNGSSWRAVGGGASGSILIGTVPLKGSSVVNSFAYFLGAGFEEVTFVWASRGYGFTATASADPNQSILLGVQSTGSQTETRVGTGSVPFGFVTNNDGLPFGNNVFNVRIGADGYLRFDITLTAGNDTATASGTRLNWRAR